MAVEAAGNNMTNKSTLAIIINLQSFIYSSGGFDQEVIMEMGPNVTFCSCNNECGPIDVFEDFVSTNDYTVTPNPISDNSVISFYNPVASYHQLMIFDTYGRVVKTYEGIVGNEIPIDRAGLDKKKRNVH